MSTQVQVERSEKDEYVLSMNKWFEVCDEQLSARQCPEIVQADFCLCNLHRGKKSEELPALKCPT